MPLRWILLIVLVAGVGIFSAQFLLAAEQLADVAIAPSGGPLPRILVDGVERPEGEEKEEKEEKDSWPVRLRNLDVNYLSCKRDDEGLLVQGVIFSQRNAVPNVIGFITIETLEREEFLTNFPIKDFGHVKGTRNFNRYLSIDLDYTGQLNCILTLQSDDLVLGQVSSGILEDNA